MCKSMIDNAIHQAQELANGFHRKLGPVYSVRYHVSNYQPSPMVEGKMKIFPGFRYQT